MAKPVEARAAAGRRPAPSSPRSSAPSAVDRSTHHGGRPLHAGSRHSQRNSRAASQPATTVIDRHTTSGRAAATSEPGVQHGLHAGRREVAELDEDLGQQPARQVDAAQEHHRDEDRQEHRGRHARGRSDRGDEQPQCEQRGHAEQERRDEPRQVAGDRDREGEIADDDDEQQADRSQRPTLMISCAISRRRRVRGVVDSRRRTPSSRYVHEARRHRVDPERGQA